MRVYLERTGGFAGMSRTTKVDTTAISQDTANQLPQLLQESDFYNLPDYIDSSSPKPDSFYYRLTVEDNGQTHTVSVGESAVPSNLKALIEWINSAAVSQNLS
jgi:hypothetical protein